jgi:hypothetical protein
MVLHSIKDQKDQGVLYGKGGSTYNNVQYIDNCFKSIKSGDPIYMSITESESVSCIEHILEDIIYGGSLAFSGGSANKNSVNPIIYEYLSDPEIDLDQPLCIAPTLRGKKPDTRNVMSCVPKIIESYSALRGYTEPLSNPDGSRIVRSTGKSGKKLTPTAEPSFGKVMEDVQSIISRYPQYLKHDSCRRRDLNNMMNCFDSVISQNNNWRIIDLSKVPEDFLNDTQCDYIRVSDNRDKLATEQAEKNKVSCYEKVIRLALRNNVPNLHSTSSAYANTLLIGMLESGRFDKEIVQESSNCNSTTANYASCFSMMIDRLWVDGNASPFKAINLIVKKFSKNHAIDAESIDSPFYGNKCSETNPSTNKTVMVNCLDQMFNRVVRVSPASESRLTSASLPSDFTAFNNLRDTLIRSDEFVNQPCRIIEALYNITPSADQPTDMMRTLMDIKTILNLDPSKSGNVFDSLKNLTATTCQNDIYGSVPMHEVNAFDLLVEKGAPIRALTGNPTYAGEILPLLNQENCNSVESGIKVNCLEKIASELYSNDKYVHAHYIISNVFGKLTYPETLSRIKSLTKAGRITQLDESNLMKNYIVVSSKENGKSIGLDDVLTDTMANLVDKYSHDPNYNVRTSTIPSTLSNVMERGYTSRVAKIADIHQWAYVNVSKYGYNTSFRNFVSYLIQSERNFGALSEDDVNHIINTMSPQIFDTSNFEYASDILTKWYDKYDETTKTIIRDNFVKYLDDARSTTSPGYRASVDHQLHNIKGDLRYVEVIDGSTRSKNNAINKFAKYIGIPSESDSTPIEPYTPTYENRAKYDVSCMKDMNANLPYKGSMRFVQRLIDDPVTSTTMRPDPFGIVGSYRVNPGEEKWTDSRLYRYAKSVGSLLHGGYIRKPYIEYEKYTQVGLHAVLAPMLVSESYGNRKDKTTATPKITFKPASSISEHYVELKRTNNDVQVKLEYIDDATGKPVDALTKVFGFRELLTSLPRKLLRKLQEINPDLFGLIQLVTSHEDAASKGGDHYTLNITNKPMDIARISSCNVWDDNSCMRIGDNDSIGRGHGGYCNTVHSYIDFGSYVAYLTKDSPYEPKWFARLLMHRCKRGNNDYLSVQTACNHYDVDPNYHKHWDIVYDAVQIILADNGVNATCNGSCTYLWNDKSDEDGSEYVDYTDTSGCAKYTKGDADYRNILKMRTDQDADSSLFVKKVLDTF